MSEEIKDWKKRESLGSAMVQIAIVAVLLAGAVYAIYQRGATKKQLSEHIAAARSKALKGNPNDLRTALKSIDDALALDPKSGDAQAVGASINTDLWLLHKEAGAEAKAKEFLAGAKTADSHAEERYGSEALHMLAAGDAKGAEDFVEGLRKKGASTARLFYAQSMAMKLQGNFPLARTGFNAAIDKAWKEALFACAAGDMMLEEGIGGAADVYSKGLSANPDNLRARLGVAHARIQRKERVGEAEGMLKEVLARDAELSPPLKARGLALQAQLANLAEQPDQAISMADQAIALNGDDPWALFAKANALALKKDPAAAPAFDAVIGKAKYAPVFYFQGAVALQAAGFANEALTLLQKYEDFFKNVKNIAADGKEVAYLERDDKYWLTRGDVLLATGKADDAMAAYDKAIAAKSVNISKAYYAKGALLVAQKQYDKAAEILQDITPPDGTGTNAEAYMAMGEVLFSKKEWGPGCQNYAFALTRMKAMQAPREKLNDVLTDVEKKLKGFGQKDVAKLWVDEAKPLIQ